MQGLHTTDPAAYAGMDAFEDPKHKLVHCLLTKTKGHPGASNPLPGQQACQQAPHRSLRPPSHTPFFSDDHLLYMGGAVW